LLADIMTIQEHFGSTRDLKVAWVGDGNNVCNSLILSTVLTGMEVTVSTPKGYEPAADIVKKAKTMGGKIALVRKPERAVKDAEVIITDTWISMGDDDEREERLRVFARYTIDAALLKLASPDARVLHCLPAHRGQEIADEVMEGGQSLVWDEAENRLHAQKALLIRLLGK
jgi:ornithine carbamoyltransferase